MSSRWYWWKRTEWSSVVLTTWTGSVTRPKLLAPDQMLRAIADGFEVVCVQAQLGASGVAGDRLADVGVDGNDD